MLKVLLVDDEEEIREGMALIIPWTNLGFFAPVTAENGIEALEMVEKVRPDIIITDIQMPFMDGLDFIKKALQILPMAKFIVISGYDSFEYAQRAITLKVDKYLLKPFSSGDLRQVLEEMKRNIEKEKLERLNIERLHQRFEMSIQMFRENFLISCLNGTIDNEAIKRQQKEFNFPDELSLRLVLFELHDSNEEMKNQSTLLKMAAKDIAEEDIKLIEEPLLFFYGENLIWLPFRANVEEIARIANKLCAFMTNLGFLTVSGISKRHVSLVELKEALTEAQSALDFSNHLDQQTSFAMIADDIPHHGVAIPLNVSELEARKLANALRYGDFEKIDALAREIFSQAQTRRLNRFEYTAFLSEWVGVLSRACSLNETEEAQQLIFRLTKEMETKIEQPFEEGCRWFTNYCHQVSELLQTDIQQSSRGQIMQGLHYIEEHFADPNLTAESLSNFLHLNSAYFSVLFKKQTGTTFVNYLTEKRVKEAKLLLENTDDKTYLIAEKVGYTESNYFSYVFKKVTGQSPTKYRKLLKVEEQS